MSARRYVTGCTKHGTLSDAKFRHAEKQVVVPEPKSKNARRFGGCPLCKREAMQAK